LNPSISGNKQTNLFETFFISAIAYIILIGVVVMTLETCAGGPGSNSFIVTIIFPLLKGKVLKTSNH
jgi:hypothetical protein